MNAATASAQGSAHALTNRGLELRGVHKSYGHQTVLTNINLSLAPNRIYGLLGANGVGKTTLISLICNHTFRSSGQVLVDGEDPAENAAVLSRMCFIREDQRYNDAYALTHLLPVLPAFYPNWSAEFANHLIERFRLPRRTQTRKLSRGQRSALAIVIALSSRAPYTFLDEPYLGLDATARTVFYEELAQDVGRHPRTIVMSTHLIDEAAALFEEVVILRDHGVALHAPVDEVTGDAFSIHGLADEIESFIGSRELLDDRRLGRMRTSLVRGTLTATEIDSAEQARLAIGHPTLQQIVAALGGLDQIPSEGDRQ